MIEAVHLSVISRYPTKEETARPEQSFGEVTNPKEAAEDLMRALTDSPASWFDR